MLAPDARTVAMDVLRPPSGYRIDQAVLCTYSLDLEVLLALPLAVLAHSDRGVEELLEDPLLLLEALREAGERVHVFVDEAGIAIPGASRALYAMLEDCVHPVRAPNGGAFHPKVWIVRFVDEDGRPFLRAAVASRNLTFDRSWDVALVSEAVAESRKKVPESRALAELLRAIPGLSARDLGAERAQMLERLADELARTAFPAPEGFKSPIGFQALGLVPGPPRPWQVEQVGRDLLAMAPFVNRSGLNGMEEISSGKHTLISRREALDDLPEDALGAWEQVLVMSDAAVDESDDDISGRISDLHAKLIALEHGHQVTWYVGSANLTWAALTGRNVEVIASITGPRGRAGGNKGTGIERFLESGFDRLCETYKRIEREPEDEALKTARGLLEKARDALVSADLKVSCRPDGESWSWNLEGAVDLPKPVTISVWPVSIHEDQARPLALPMAFSLPLSRLTAFVAFRLSVKADIDDIRLALKLPAEGMPEGRMAQVLRTLIDSPERFLQFLRALLGGLDTLPAWAGADSGGSWQGRWVAGLVGETLLEDLVRAASRDQRKLEPVRRLIEDLRATPEGRKIVPDDLYALWEVVDAALNARNAG